MAAITRGRVTAELAEGSEPVVFLIGMRINHPLRPWTWLPLITAMGRMIAELMRDPELGLLAAPRTFLSGRLIQVQQYWASSEHLERYARAADRQHLPAWRRFNAKVRDSGAVGIYHEIYRVTPSSITTMYVNVPPLGLAAATSAVPAARGRSAD
jgi:hypothetical protein